MQHGNSLASQTGLSNQQFLTLQPKIALQQGQSFPPTAYFKFSPNSQISSYPSVAPVFLPHPEPHLKYLIAQDIQKYPCRNSSFTIW